MWLVEIVEGWSIPAPDGTPVPKRELARVAAEAEVERPLSDWLGADPGCRVVRAVGPVRLRTATDVLVVESDDGPEEVLAEMFNPSYFFAEEGLAVSGLARVVDGELHHARWTIAPSPGS